MNADVDDYVTIFTRHITTRNGKKLLASDYGHKAFRLLIPRDKYRKHPEDERELPEEDEEDADEDCNSGEDEFDDYDLPYGRNSRAQSTCNGCPFAGDWNTCLHD